MNTFKQILKNDKNVAENAGTVAQNIKNAVVAGVNRIPDPRSDLAEDSLLWTHFLALAIQESRCFYGALHGFRCMGTRLVRAGVNAGNWAGLYVLRPDVDPTGADSWESRERYEEDKTKHLKPVEAELFALLRKLNENVKKGA